MGGIGLPLSKCQTWTYGKQALKTLYASYLWGDIMAKIWRNRLIAGTQKFEYCPARYKDEVVALLRQDVADGVITAERFKEITDIDYE